MRRPIHVGEELVRLLLPLLELLEVVTGQMTIVDVNEQKELASELLLHSELDQALGESDGQVCSCGLIAETERGHDKLGEHALLVPQHAVEEAVDHHDLHEDSVERHAHGTDVKIPEGFSDIKTAEKTKAADIAGAAEK